MKKWIITVIILALPVIITYIAAATALTYLTTVSFFLGVVGMSLLIYSITRLSNHSVIKTSAIICLYCVIFIELIDLICIFKSAKPFNNDFVQHCDIHSLTVASPIEIASMCYMSMTIFILSIFGYLVYRKNDDCVNSNVSRILTCGIFIVGITFTLIFNNPISDVGGFIYGLYFKYKATTEYNVVLMPLAGVKVCDIDYDNLKVVSGKNLVFVYVESFEDTFTDEKIFPNLTPNVNRLKKESVVFKNIKHSAYAGCTIAGIYTSMSGSQPLPCQGIPGTTKNSNDLNCMLFPQILMKAKYRQLTIYGQMMCTVGGVIELMNNMGINVINPIDEKGNSNLYTSDDELFKLGLKSVEKYSKMNRPYNIMIITSDSHVSGYIKPEWEQYDVKKMKNPPSKNNTNLTAIKHTDKVLGEFTDKMKQREDWNNTVIFVMNDHLILPGTCTDLVNRNPNRNMLMFAIGGGIEPMSIDSTGKHFDAAPTVLDILGVKSNYVFPIGESLMGHPSPLRLNDSTPLRYECLTQYIEHRKNIAYNKCNAFDIKTMLTHKEK